MYLRQVHLPKFGLE